MSGHSGFQPIGNHLQPILPQPQVGNVEGPGQAPVQQPPAVLGEGAPANGPEVQQANARTLAQKLDVMLLQAAKMSSNAVTSEAVTTAADMAELDKADRKKLAAATIKAQKTLKALGEFTGRQIASALVPDKNGVFDWKSGNKVAAAISKAINAQAALSELITDLLNRTEMSGNAFDTFTELALQCDRRQSEISTLAMQLAYATSPANVVSKAKNDPEFNKHLDELNKHLDDKLTTLLPRQVISMHDNAGILNKLKEQLQPLADRLEAFASQPNASLTSEEYMAYSIEVKDASAAISHALQDGFPSPDGSRHLVLDRDFMKSLSALASYAEGKLEDTRKNIGQATLGHFVNHVIGLPERYGLFDPRNIGYLSEYAPQLSKWVERRLHVHRACLAYIADPTQENLAKIEDCLSKFSNVETTNLKREYEYLEDHLKSNMTKDDWKRARQIFRPKPCTLKTQVAHLVQMVKNVREKMTPEQFLSTESARALFEGRIAFSTLVESRVHGMSDADVDPKLDDSRLASSKVLGSGKVNVVRLVTYKDGAEYVFKPEARGRQTMESLTLSKDYSSEQMVSQLNLANQSVANALGLEDTIPKCSVGVHNGEYGLFMEKVTGLSGKDYADGKNTAPGSLPATKVRDLSNEQHAKVLGGILRGLNRLEWLDLITGQGDRHGNNYLIDVKEDLTVIVKGIDNDQSFPAYRTGLRTYVLKGKDADKFIKKRKETILAYPAKYQEAVEKRVMNDPGVTQNPDGSIVLDTTKFKAGELYFAAQATIGMHGCNLPDYIDADLYTQLIALKSGDKRDALLADLASRLSPAAVDAARNRLDAAIAHAEKLASEGKVVNKADFAKRDVQKSLLARELQAPDNPIKPVNRYELPSDCDIMRKAKRQIHSIFVRDLFSKVVKNGWFN